MIETERLSLRPYNVVQDLMIETERLSLRPYREEDFEAIYAMSSDARIHTYLGNAPSTREEAWSRLLRNVGHWSLKDFGVFAIFEKASGRFVGNTGLAFHERGLGRQFDPYPEAGWVLTYGSHGKGYASEAALAAHRWFDAQGVARRTVCIIVPENAASFRVAEKLGYRSFGHGEHRGSPVVMLERVRAA
jgi:RimJ/RimL family protein N-acetyltransferase